MQRRLPKMLFKGSPTQKSLELKTLQLPGMLPQAKLTLDLRIFMQNVSVESVRKTVEKSLEIRSNPAGG